MIDILYLLLEWSAIAFGAAVGFGIMARRLEQEAAERDDDERYLDWSQEDKLP
jgi:hypothetical protein